jgi:hypothetical protein
MNTLSDAGNLSPANGTSARRKRMSDQVTNKNAVPEESQVRVLEMALPSSASSSDMLLRRIGTYWWRADAPWLRSSRSVATLSLFKTSARGFLVFIRG